MIYVCKILKIERRGLRMDLVAYSQIEDLDKIAKENNIVIPRLRGYRLMRNEKPISQEEINQQLNKVECDVIKDLTSAIPSWTDSHCYAYSIDRENEFKKYVITETVTEEDGFTYEKPVRVKWELIHGKKLKIAKRLIKRKKQKIIKEYEIWNKYAGRPDVLYIHPRMGGNNWQNYENKIDILNASWFLDRVDNHFDSTYCDFYAKIKTD